jgi:hypothetical protein
MLETSDQLVLWGFERLFNWIEDRYGRLAAWLVTSALALGIVAAVFAILIAIF